MKSILFFIGTIYQHQFRGIILERNAWFHCFAAFLKSRLNFKYFEKKDDPNEFCSSEIRDSENVVR